MYYAYYLLHCYWMACYSRLTWQSHALWFSGSMDASIELDSDIALVLGKAAHALAYASPRLELPEYAESLLPDWNFFGPVWDQEMEKLPY